MIITGAGSNQKGAPEGYRLRGHHWPERWITGGDGQRVPELFIAGELLAAGGRAVLEVMLHEAAHALATRRGIKDTSAQGNRYHNIRYHNMRFAALAAELGLRGPDGPAKVTGWSGCTLTEETAAAYTEMTDAVDRARLPFLPDPVLAGTGGDGGGGGEDEDGGDKPAKRGGRGRRRVRVPARAPAHPAHAQADRGRPNRVRPVLRPVRTARDDQDGDEDRLPPGSLAT